MSDGIAVSHWSGSYNASHWLSLLSVTLETMSWYFVLCTYVGTYVRIYIVYIIIFLVFGI